MALNFSHRPILPAHLSEDKLVSSMRIANGYLADGIQEKVEGCFDYGRDRGDMCGSHESVSSDILDLLPSDPFDMGMRTTFTAITNWFEDFKVDYGGFRRNDVGKGYGDYQLYTGLKFFWNNGMKSHDFSMGFDHKLNTDGRCRSICLEKGVEEEIRGSEVGLADDDGAPHQALHYAFAYLGVRDLLVVETVCKTLRDTIRSDTLCWKNIHIGRPLNEKITDDILLELTNRALGKLESLTLVECTKITDDGLKRVLEKNGRLRKLCVPGCTRLSIEGIVTSLATFKNVGTQGVKQLRIGGIYGVTEKHFEELKLLLGIDSCAEQNAHSLHIYNRGNMYFPCDDDHPIDIESCPRCQNPRLVYDCPVEGCLGKKHTTQACRACAICIRRCAVCGRCINDCEYVENFCLESLCSACGDGS